MTIVNRTTSIIPLFQSSEPFFLRHLPIISQSRRLFLLHLRCENKNLSLYSKVSSQDKFGIIIYRVFLLPWSFLQSPSLNHESLQAMYFFFQRHYYILSQTTKKNNPYAQMFSLPIQQFLHCLLESYPSVSAHLRSYDHNRQRTEPSCVRIQDHNYADWDCVCELPHILTLVVENVTQDMDQGPFSYLMEADARMVSDKLIIYIDSKKSIRSQYEPTVLL